MVYRFLGQFYPKKIRENYLRLLKYSSIKINEVRFVGFVTLSCFLLSLAFTFYIAFFFKKVPFLMIFAGLFFLLQVLVYFVLLLRADAKAKFVENILPDVLQLMASNLRSGLTADKALLLAARPEFGPFRDEINNVGKEITMGKEIGEALSDMSNSIKSERLGKTTSLIITGLKSGGELASLLDQTARNLRQERLVDSRIRASVMMYVIFIFAAVCFGAPLLFGLSSFLVEFLTESLGRIEMPETAATNLPLNFTNVSISLDFVILFAVLFLLSSSILGSLLLGLISRGKEREGIKFMPFLAILSISIFFIIRFAIKHMLGGLFQI